MTREEMWKEFENQLIRETRISMSMSFDAVERTTILGIKETVAKWKDRLEQEPCEDAVSKKQTLLALTGKNLSTKSTEELISLFNKRIKALPSVTPTHKKGKWERGYSFPDGEYVKCTVCGEIIKCIYPMHYCPNCGAEMESEE